MRGPQVTFIGKRRQGRIIQAVSTMHIWRGRRGRARLTIYKATQPTLDGQVIVFTATLFYERVTGYAATVVEAIEKLEIWYRERTMQHDPRRNRSDSNRRVTGRRRGVRLPDGEIDQAPAPAPTKRRGKRAPRASTRGRKAEQ